MHFKFNQSKSVRYQLSTTEKSLFDLNPLFCHTVPLNNKNKHEKLQRAQKTLKT